MKMILKIIMILMVSSVIQCERGAEKVKYELDPNLGFPTGPAINEKVPEFSLPDQDGIIRNIKDLVDRNGAVLNFYRSASW